VLGWLSFIPTIVDRLKPNDYLAEASFDSHKNSSCNYEDCQRDYENCSQKDCVYHCSCSANDLLPARRFWSGECIRKDWCDPAPYRTLSVVMLGLSSGQSRAVQGGLAPGTQGRPAQTAMLAGGLYLDMRSIYRCAALHRALGRALRP